MGTSLTSNHLGFNREFLVPTQLHEVFCWIHGYDPLDLLGKPWDRYHLELQLLQDALKVARTERRKINRLCSSSSSLRNVES